MSTDLKKDIESNHEPNDDDDDANEAPSPAEKEDVFNDEKFNDTEDSSTVEDSESDDDMSKSDRDVLVRALARQAYHLPGNTTWWQDWRQYFGNNHPLLGICFHHRLHPIPWYMRVLHLVSSVVFGLAITNLVWIWFVLDDNMSEDQVLVNVDVGISSDITQLKYVEQLNENNEVELTTGMVVLWTLGATVHSFYDSIIWRLTLCTCCMEGRRHHWAAKYKNVGVGLLSLGIILLLAATSLIVVVRSSAEQEEAKAMLIQEFKKQIDWQDAGMNIDWKNNDLYQFLLGYSIELALSLLVYFFITGTIMFAGIFGCSGRHPMLGSLLGGRPHELKQLEKQSGEGVEVVLDNEGHEDIQSGRSFT